MSIDLTNGPVTKKMMLFSLPLIAGNLLQQTYNIADTVIVGRFLGADALAAVGSSYTLMTFLTSILLGLCMGSGALFSIRYGEKNVEKLKELGFEITLHDKMPDVVLYREDKNWIYFVESVTSVSPMDPKRILEITEMTKDVTAGKIFITAFLDFKTYKKFAEELAWETEVWIAEMPEHMIHLNGDRFMGPR